MHASYVSHILQYIVTEYLSFVECSTEWRTRRKTRIMPCNNLWIKKKYGEHKMRYMWRWLGCRARVKWFRLAWKHLVTGPSMSAKAAVSTAAGTADKQHSRTWSFVPACNSGRKKNIFSTFSIFCLIHTTRLQIHWVCRLREITACFTIFRGLLWLSVHHTKPAELSRR